MGVRKRVISRTESWHEVEDEGGKGKLYEHVDAGCEQGEVEVEMLWREHPFVILKMEC